MSLLIEDGIKTQDLDVAETVANVDSFVGNIGGATRIIPMSLINTVINARRFGAMGDGTTDDTAAINNALTASSGAGVLLTDGVFMVEAEGDGILMLDNTHLIIDKSATLKAFTATSGVYSIIAIRNKTGVKITGGGTVFGERGTHVGSVGEYGMGITVDQSSKVIIGDLEILNCFGDGIYIGGGTTATQPTDVVISRVKSLNNRRQGLSITNVKGLTVIQSEFSNTTGTAPAAGIDFEPNADQSIENLYFDTIDCSNNQGCGINGYLSASYTGAFMKNINIKNLITNNNGSHGVGISNAGTAVQFIKFNIEGHTSEDNGGKGFWLNNLIGGAGTNIHVDEPVGTGIELDSIQDFTLTDPIIKSTGAATGITMLGFGSTNLTIKGPKIKTVNYGVSSFSSCVHTGLKIIDGKDICASGQYGIFLQNVIDSEISRNNMKDCGAHAIRLVDSNDNLLLLNKIRGAGIATDNIYSGISLEGTSSNNTIQVNQIRLGVNANRMKFAVALGASTSGNFIINNDLTNSGFSGKISDAGTGNIVVENRSVPGATPAATTVIGNSSTPSVGVIRGDNPNKGKGGGLQLSSAPSSAPDQYIALGESSPSSVFTSMLKVYCSGAIEIPSTIAGTAGAQTINKSLGSVKVAAGQTSVVVTNAIATTTSFIFLTVTGTIDATATKPRVTKAAGSFTITFEAAATADVAVDFFVLN